MREAPCLSQGRIWLNDSLKLKVPGRRRRISRITVHASLNPSFSFTFTHGSHGSRGATTHISDFTPTDARTRHAQECLGRVLVLECMPGASAVELCLWALLEGAANAKLCSRGSGGSWPAAQLSSTILAPPSSDCSPGRVHVSVVSAHAAGHAVSCISHRASAELL